MGNKQNIVIVDDNKQFVEGLLLLLSKRMDVEIVGVANNGEELMVHSKLAYADIILLDIEMPGMTGFEVAKRINWRYPNIKLIAITMYQEKVYLEKLVKSGFKGFVNKTDITEKLFPVLDAVINGKLFFPDNISLL